MTDLAHKALEQRMLDAREAYLSALDACTCRCHNRPVAEHDACCAADLAEFTLDDLLDQYLHLPQQDDRLTAHPTDTP